MGYYGRIEVKLKARKMRSKGKSYIEIMQRLHLPKATVSDWCKDVPLTKDQIRKLYESKKDGALKGSIIAARNKQRERLLVTEKLYKQGQSEIGKLSNRDQFMIGVALYAAEGTKVDKVCCFSNSDPLLVRFMVRWFCKFGKVPINKFHGALWLHEQRDELKSKQFWSRLTRIPLGNFYKSYIAENKKHSRKIRKKVHEYGVFSFYISDVTLLRKIMGWIGGIVQKPWYNTKVH